MRRILRCSALAVLVSTGAACGDSGTAAVPDPIASGSWAGSFQTTQGTDVDATMTITEDAAGGLTGSGNFSVGTAGAIAFTVSGAHAHPSISMTLSSAGNADTNLSGQMFPSGDSITGRLNGSGFIDTQISLGRR